MPVENNPYYDYYIDFALPQELGPLVYNTVTKATLAQIFKEIIQYLNSQVDDDELWELFTHRLVDLTTEEYRTLHTLASLIRETRLGE